MNDIILSEIQNGVGVITLNSPKSLNSISLEMALALMKVLSEWKTNPEVRCVFLQGNEKAFCAGGDVRRLYQALKQTPKGVVSKEAFDFFIDEYRLDYTIHTYPKPIVAWGDGIVMGGGIGIFIGASHRVVTEKSKLAMPEITIGLYPDVGATWFLNRMPDGWGNYFGLTGARMNAGDALHLGLANFYQASEARHSILDQLQKINWTLYNGENKILIDQVLKSDTTPESPVRNHSIFANKLSAIRSVHEFKKLLTDEARSDEWLQAGLKLFSEGSPTSAKVIYEQLQRGKHLSLEDVFRSELNLSVQFSLRADFVEGVRALLIDKDYKPQWHPATLDEVSSSDVESYFTPLWPKENHPLFSFYLS